MKISFIVEGPDDEDFIRYFLEDSLIENGYHVELIKPLYGSKIFTESPKHVDLHLNFFSIQRVFILVDLHKFPCKTYVLKKFGSLRDNPNVKIIIVIREITAWFLADFEAIEWVKKGSAKLLRSIVPNENTESLSNPKEVFNQLKGQKIRIRTLLKRQISKKFDIERARTRNPSLNRLLNELKL
jgi:hypothetical protein